jgi:hypothetical protein
MAREGWTLIVVVAFAACSGPVVEGSVPQTLLSMPTDGTTGLNMAQISFQTSPGPLDPETQSLLQTATTLVTWPDQTTVPSDIVLANVVLDPMTIGGFTVEARNTSEGGWYAALLPRVPSTLNFPAQTFHSMSDGRHAVRIFVGSAPALLRVDVCAKDGNPIGDLTEVIVTFSETVHAATTSTNPLAVEAGPAGAAQPCTSDAVPLVDRPAGTYTYLCAAALGASEVVTVSISAGLVSLYGESVAVGDRAIVFGSLPASVAMAGCSSLKIDP